MQTDVNGRIVVTRTGGPEVLQYIEEKIPDKSATLVLYCGGGFRSALVADNLQKMGYRNAISLDGGWRALKESGLELS